MPMADGSEQGSAAVEFALVLPLLLVMALALVQVGLVVRDRLLVEDAARAAGRAASIGPDPVAIAGAAQRAAPALDPRSLQVSVRRGAGRGDPVTVTVTYTDRLRVPFVSWLFNRSVVMLATTTDRQEFG
jgi:Flp pilus assembly protein TadG